MAVVVRYALVLRVLPISTQVSPPSRQIMMSEPTSDTAPPTSAPYPFNQTSADLTLRTPDRVDFLVHSPILAQASPVFADMFSLPQPSSVSRDVDAVRPIVEVTEDSKTLERLLRLCYPIKKEKLVELEDLVPVLQAAMKYDMEWPIYLLTTDLLALAPRSPLKVWAIASRCGLEALALEAAASILRQAKGQPQVQPQQPSPSVPPLTLLKTMLEEHGKQVLQGISAADYFRLREYLRAGDEAATATLLSPTVLLPSSGLTFEPSPPPPMIPQFPPPDLTLRCPDGTEYPVHALFIMLYSPILAERVRATSRVSSSPEAQPTSTRTESHHPLLEVDIDPPKLSALLAALYGGSATQLPSDLRSLGSTIVAADRFGIAHVVELAKEQWNNLAASNPLGAYFVAIECGLPDYARSAARKVLESPVAGTYVAVMEAGTALTYHHLLEYYRACARSIDAHIKAAVPSWNQHLTISTSGGYYGGKKQSCYGGMRDPQHVPRKYSSTMDTDIRGTGCSFDLTLPDLLQASSSAWPSCTATESQSYVEGLVKVSAALPQTIADAIAEVQLEIQ